MALSVRARRAQAAGAAADGAFVDPRLPPAMLAAGIGVDELARLCGVTRRTVQRWRSRPSGPPLVHRYLEIAAGALPWSDWYGWQCVGGRLYPPTWRDGLTPNDVASVFFLRQMVDALRSELARYHPGGGSEHHGDELERRRL